MKKKLLTVVASALIVAGGLFAYLAIQPDAEAKANFGNCKRDKDSNAIIKDGACNSDELEKNFKKTKDAKSVFEKFGVPTSNFSSAVEGKVHKDGRVTVDGETVATGAKTVGRHHIPGSSKTSISGKTYYERSPSVSFRSDSIKAFVFLDKHGEFIGAVISSCGNPVSGNPKPKPSYACEDLQVAKVDRTRFDLSVATKEHRASFKSATFNVYDADGNKVANPTSNSKDYSLTLDTPGTYTIKAQVTFKVGKGEKTTKETSRCKVNVEVKAEPCPYNPELPIGHPDCKEPVEPVYACDGLDVEKISRTDFRFTTSTSEEHAEFTGVTYVITDSDGNEVDRVESSDKTADYSISQAGTYNVQALVHFTVDGETKTVEDNKCRSSFTVKAEPCPYNPELPIGHPDCKEPVEPVYVCDNFTIERISEHNFRFTTSTSEEEAEFVSVTYVITNEAGEEIDRIETDNKTTDYAMSQPGTYNVRTILTFTIDGETKTVEDENCVGTITIEEEPEETPCIHDESLPEGHPDCVAPETPEEPEAPVEEKPVEEKGAAPAEMPKTGVGSVLSAFAGIGSLAGAGYYYFGSRRELLGKLLDR